MPSAARKIYPIVKYGAAVLEKPGAPIKKFDADLEQLTEDMFASMYAAQGVGLAAPQIGLSLRIAVVDVTGGKNPEAKIVLANPEVVHAEGEVREEEGCLSVPGVSRVRAAAAVCDHQGRRTRRVRRLKFAVKTCWRGRSAMKSITSTESFFAAPQHAEARPDQAQNQEAQETGRVVSAGAGGRSGLKMRIVSVGRPPSRFPRLNISSHKQSLKSLV